MRRSRSHSVGITPRSAVHTHTAAASSHQAQTSYLPRTNITSRARTAHCVYVSTRTCTRVLVAHICASVCTAQEGDGFFGGRHVRIGQTIRKMSDCRHYFPAASLRHRAHIQCLVFNVGDAWNRHIHTHTYTYTNAPTRTQTFTEWARALKPDRAENCFSPVHKHEQCIIITCNIYTASTYLFMRFALHQVISGRPGTGAAVNRRA